MPDTCSSPAPSVPETHSGRETILALCVLASLTVIAIGMAMVQSQFNPAVVNFLQGAADRAQGLPAAPATVEPILPLPEGMSLLTPAERFDRETLSDKIDGKAELYLSAGFIRLDSQRLALAGQPDLWVEVFIYDMGSFENAYAVFSAQRRADATMLDFAEFAYRAENALFFVHGPYYLELIASGTDDRLRTSMDALARALILSRTVAQATIAERDLFPKPGLVATSISLIPADAFGVADLDRVFTATYAIAGSEMTAFLSRRADPQAAAALAGAYVDFLKTYGGEVKASDEPVAGGAVVAILDMYEVVFAEGPFLAGVHEAPDRDKAVALAKELAAKLKEVSGAR
ncbi:MAG TPA: DUF6599 family protein [Desulfobacterales bacterium]|nr:DUF6599 family protein [Desulfobacterales bacterium]